MLFQALDSRAGNAVFSAVFHQGRRDVVITFALPPPTLFSSQSLVTGTSEAVMVL